MKHCLRKDIIPKETLFQGDTMTRKHYVLLKFMLGWVRTILPSRFQFKFEKKEAPFGVPGTSIRSVPTLTGEGINTYTYPELKVKKFNTLK